MALGSVPAYWSLWTPFHGAWILKSVPQDGSISALGTCLDQSWVSPRLSELETVTQLFSFKDALKDFHRMFENSGLEKQEVWKLRLVGCGHALLPPFLCSWGSAPCPSEEHCDGTPAARATCLELQGRSALALCSGGTPGPLRCLLY